MITSVMGNKNDRIDAHKLANWLRLGELKKVYQGDRNNRKLRDLAHGYLATVSDSIRIMNRIKALYRSWSIHCAGRDVYYKRNRDQWLSKFPITETRMRAVLYYAQLDLLKEQRKEIKKIFLKEAKRYPIQKILRYNSRFLRDPFRFCDCSNWNPASLPYPTSTMVLLRIYRL